MMRYRRFWNHRPDFRRYIRKITRLDYGIITSIDYLDPVCNAEKTGVLESGRAATIVHDRPSIGTDDSAWIYLGGDTTIAVSRSAGILVIQHAIPDLGCSGKVAECNSWRVFWIVVRNSQGVMLESVRWAQRDKEVVLSVGLTHLEAVLAILIPIATRRRSNPSRQRSSIFGAFMRCIGSRRPYRRFNSTASPRSTSAPAPP